MCDLIWEEVKMTHKQLNIPDHSISNPGVVSRSSVISAPLHSLPAAMISHALPFTSPCPWESSPRCQNAEAGGGSGAGAGVRTLQDSEDDTRQLTQKTET